MKTNYNELIGYDSDGNAVILLYTFDHGSGFVTWMRPELADVIREVEGWH